MKCLEREQLFAFAHGMLETRQAAEVRAHLAGCAACQEVVTEYLRLDSALDEWKPVEPSAGFDARVRQAVNAQGKARDSSLWGGLFALTWARWLAPASLAVLVGVVALGLYRSHRVWGPASRESSAQRPSPAAQQAPPPSAETPQEAVVEKKSAPMPGALPAKQKAGSLMANEEATAQSGGRLAQSADASTSARVQSMAPTGSRGEAPPRPYGAVSGADPRVETQRDALARAAGVPEATAQPSASATGGALAWRHAEATNQPQRVLQAVQSAPVSAEAQPQATPAPPAPESVAKAQSGAAMGATARQMTATPEVTTTTAKSFSSGKGLALRSRSSYPATPPPPGLLESFLKQHPDAVLIKQLLGTLAGRRATKATLTAVVASDPANSAMKAKGLVVQLEDGNHTATVYLDDDGDADTGADSLREFQEGLERDADKDKVLEYWREIGKADGDWTRTLDALNRAAGSPGYCCPRYPVINVGWYKQGEDLGVAIVSLGPVAWFYFPGSELSQVVKMIADGRAFLDAN